MLENWLEAKAGLQPYQGGFLLHYLDKLAYPDISAAVPTVSGVLICVLNLALYARQMGIARKRYYPMAHAAMRFGETRPSPMVCMRGLNLSGEKSQKS